jgi:NAD(P)-dependent dehydrogenase (short-subunit alcohol dehydrogenase family)
MAPSLESAGVAMSQAAVSRTVIVTGAAGALGRAVVAHFVGGGARLALVERDAAALRAAFPDLAGNAQHVLAAADVTSEASMRPAMQRIIAAFGRIDVLVHVAGGFEMGEATHALTRASWDRMMDLNAWSFVTVTRDVIPQMLVQGSGRVIAVSARAAQRGPAQTAAYAASKSALQRLVESLSAEVAARGISVNSIAPIIMDTPANRDAMPQADRSTWVPTAMAARAIGFLASAEGGWVHGQHLVVGVP